jgi:heme-degrading monooxygenase HmoA
MHVASVPGVTDVIPAPVAAWHGLIGICQARGMVLEIAGFQVTPGAESAFTDAYRGVREVVTSTPGCRSVRMTRSVESPSHFVLLVEWDSLEAHEQNFRATDRFTRWRAALSGFFADAPVLEHVEDV